MFSLLLVLMICLLKFGENNYFSVKVNAKFYYLNEGAPGKIGNSR